MVNIFQAHIRDGVVVPDAPLDLPDGMAVAVRIVGRAPRKTESAADSPAAGASMLELLETMSSPGVFRSSSDADKYLQDERDSWDS